MNPLSFDARALGTLALAIGASLLIGCGASDSEAQSDEPVDEDVATSTEAVDAACHRWKGIFPQTHDVDRWVIERALTWVDEKVMYSQVQTTDGFRQDCSGFVSMSWKLNDTKPGLVSWTMDQRSHEIAWHDLVPGDALVVPHSHVFLFAGWADKAHTEMCAIEEYATGVPAQITLRSRASTVASGYQPIRRDKP